MAASGGIGAVTLGRVADDAGIVVGSLRHIFSSRDDLLQGMAEQLAIRAEASSHERDAVFRRFDIAPKELAWTLPHSRERRMRWRVEQALLVESRQHPGFSDAVARCREARRRDCEKVVQTLARPFGVPQNEQDFEAKRTLALFEGLSYQIGAAVTGNVDKAEARRMLEDSLAGLSDRWRLRRRR